MSEKAPDASGAPVPRPARPARGDRRVSPRPFVIAALLIIGVPLLGYLGMTWYFRAKANVEACFTEPAMVLMQGGGDEWIERVSVSADGARGISAEGKAVRLWDLRSGRAIRTLRDSDLIYCAALSPDGRLALVGGYPTFLTLYDLESGEEIREFLAQGPWRVEAIASLDFSPAAGDEHAICASDYGSIKLVDLGSGRVVREMKGHDGGIRSVRFSPDGKRVLSGGSDGIVRLWEVESGRELKQLSGHGDVIMAVAPAPDGRHALSGGGGTVILWDLERGREVRRFEGHNAAVTSLAFVVERRGGAALPRDFLSGSRDGPIRLWDLGSGKLVRAYVLPKEKGTMRWVNSIAFSPETRLLLAGGQKISRHNKVTPELYLWRVPGETWLGLLGTQEEEGE